MSYMQIIGWVMCGGLAVALINNIGNIALWVMGRKATITDKRDDLTSQYEDMKNDIEQLKSQLRDTQQALIGADEGLKVMLFDRIKFIGTRYIDEQKVDFDDRALLNRMNKVYGEVLKGEDAENLKILLNEVNELPLSVQHHSPNDNK